MPIFFTVCESVSGHGDKWNDVISGLSGLSIAAESAEEAQNTAEQHLTAKIDEIMGSYTGPRGTEPTGLSSLVVSVWSA
jgi:hypothetical protein